MEKIKLQNRPFGPFPTVLVGADVNGKANYATLGAYGVVCLKPILYISLKSTHHTTSGVKENGYFSVNIPSADLVQKTDYCGIVSGKAPMISECPINYLCKVIQTIPIFDFEMFLGEIVAVYANEHCLTEGRPDPLKINPIIMMDTNYCDLNHVIGSLFKVGQSKSN